MKKLLKLILLTVALLAGASGAQAQHRHQAPDDGKRERFVAKQAAHIADKLGLNDDRRSRFMATYTAYQKELWALGRPKPTARGHHDCMTECQTDSMIHARFDHHQKTLDLRRKYYAEYSQFLTAKQIERVYELEHQMMERLRQRHKDRKECRTDRSSKGSRAAR